MKSIFVNIKNLFPYLCLLIIYFFFVNIEAKNNNIQNKINPNENIDLDNKSVEIDKTIRIPVIPFEE